MHKNSLQEGDSSDGFVAGGAGRQNPPILSWSGLVLHPLLHLSGGPTAVLTGAHT